MKLLFTVITFLFFLANPAWAIYYVKTTGSDANSCAQIQVEATPARQISRAIDCVHQSGTGAGKEIRVFAGNYVKFDTTSFPNASGTSGNVLLIRPNPGEAVNINADGPGGQDFVGITGLSNIQFGDQNATNSTRLGFFIIGPFSMSLTGGTNVSIVGNEMTGMFITGGSTNSNLTNNFIHDVLLDTDPDTHCVYITGITTGFTVDNNRIDNCIAWGMTITSNHVNDVLTNITVKRNWVSRTGGPGIGCSGVNNCNVYNNVISSTQSGFGGLFVAGTGTFYSNTLWDNEIGGTYDTNSGQFYRNNLIFGNLDNRIVERNGASVTATFTDNFCPSSGLGCNDIGNTRLVDPANGDFRQCQSSGVPTASCTGASASIDSAGALGSPWNVDKALTARPQGSAYDAGALEAGVGGGGGTPTPIVLVGRYSCDNVVTDSSGLGHNGTLTGGATYNASGKYNQACSFDGVNDHVSIADHNDFDMTTGFSILAWVKATNNTLSYVVSKVNPASGDGSYTLGNSDSFCGSGGPFGGYIQGGDVTACHGTALLNTFTHLAVTYEAVGDPNVKLYKDKTLVNQASGSATLTVGTGNLSIGSFGGVSDFVAGLVDEIWIFKGAVPATGPNDGECTTAWSTSNYSVARIADCAINTPAPAAPVGLKVGGTGTQKIGGSGVLKFGS